MIKELWDFTGQSSWSRERRGESCVMCFWKFPEAHFDLFPFFLETDSQNGTELEFSWPQLLRTDPTSWFAPSSSSSSSSCLLCCSGRESAGLKPEDHSQTERSERAHRASSPCEVRRRSEGQLMASGWSPRVWICDVGGIKTSDVWSVWNLCCWNGTFRGFVTSCHCVKVSMAHVLFTIVLDSCSFWRRSGCFNCENPFLIHFNHQLPSGNGSSAHVRIKICSF